MKETVKIVIPIYKDTLSESEVISLKRVFEVYRNYKIIFVAPQGTKLDHYRFVVSEIVIECLFVDRKFMSSIAGYNALMLSSTFYENFSDVKYILIYQLDAYIFRDNLIEWCNKNYDYIGAPWINWEWSSFYAKHLTLPRRILDKLGYTNFNLVGNGGLSLRKVESFIDNLIFFKKQAAKFSKNEDFFFSFYITSYNPFFKIPSVSEALNFAFDENPDQALILNNNKLPMGCHAWPKYIDFWKEYITIGNLQ